MKQPTVVRDFSELKYLLKSGHAPVKERKTHKGNWSIFYGDREIESNMPYPVCQEKVNVYKRMGKVWPRPDLLKIKPFKIK